MPGAVLGTGQGPCSPGAYFLVGRTDNNKLTNEQMFDGESAFMTERVGRRQRQPVQLTLECEVMDRGDL